MYYINNLSFSYTSGGERNDGSEREKKVRKYSTNNFWEIIG